MADFATIQTIMRLVPGIERLTVLSRADRLFSDRCGRYYGGSLTPMEVAQLLDGLERYPVYILVKTVHNK